MKENKIKLHAREEQNSPNLRVNSLLKRDNLEHIEIQIYDNGFRMKIIKCYIQEYERQLFSMEPNRPWFPSLGITDILDQIIFC